MDKIYFNQISVTQPMAEGVAEAMASWEAMDSEKLVQETREQISTLFRGRGLRRLSLQRPSVQQWHRPSGGLFKEGDHVLVSSLENDEVIGALEAIGHETGATAGAVWNIQRFHAIKKGSYIYMIRRRYGRTDRHPGNAPAEYKGSDFKLCFRSLRFCSPGQGTRGICTAQRTDLYRQRRFFRRLCADIYESVEY